MMPTDNVALLILYFTEFVVKGSISTKVYVKFVAINIQLKYIKFSECLLGLKAFWAKF